MPWCARLDLDYRVSAAKTTVRYQHDGPLRILQSLYPEGDAVCHNVLVHPPGGLVGGDSLEITAKAGPGAHGLITTPGATRFYRSLGEPARQQTQLTLEAGARMEWLPLETICYNHCLAENSLTLQLVATSELIGWDITALGLPHADQAFDSGHFSQHIEMPGIWLERGLINATDSRLMNSPLGLAGRRCLATVFFLAGHSISKDQRQTGLDLAREIIEHHELATTTGATSPHAQVIVVRVLAPLVEPALDLLKKIRGAWREHFWQLPPTPARIWAT